MVEDLQPLTAADTVQQSWVCPTGTNLTLGCGLGLHLMVGRSKNLNLVYLSLCLVLKVGGERFVTDLGSIRRDFCKADGNSQRLEEIPTGIVSIAECSGASEQY